MPKPTMPKPTMPKREESRLSSLKRVRDDELLCRLSDLVKQSRGVEVEVVAHIAEVELRRLYARQACSSMFEYCRRILGLRENETYLRITVARASRQYPLILEMLGDGRLHLSGIARLAPHLTRENAATVLERACGMSHREVRELVAELEPRPDVASTVRKLPERLAAVRASPPQTSPQQLGAPRVESDAVSFEPNRAAPSGFAPAEPLARARRAVVEPSAPARPAVVEPLAPARYQVRFTASAELRDKLERLQALMRSSVPDGDLGRIIDVAISEKLERIDARRFGRRKNPHKDRPERAASTTPSRSVPAGLAATHTSGSSRHIPAAVRRRVHARDGGRCAYRNSDGLRCARRHDLEFHHRHPFAHGGDHSPANLALMCRTHNTLLAERDYGEDVMSRFRAGASRDRLPGDEPGARIAVQPGRVLSGPD